MHAQILTNVLQATPFALFLYVITALRMKSVLLREIKNASMEIVLLVHQIALIVPLLVNVLHAPLDSPLKQISNAIKSAKRVSFELLEMNVSRYVEKNILMLLEGAILAIQMIRIAANCIQIRILRNAM